MWGGCGGEKGNESVPPHQTGKYEPGGLGFKVKKKKKKSLLKIKLEEKVGASFSASVLGNTFLSLHTKEAP